MPSRAERRTVATDLTDPDRGRFDPARVGRPNPLDQEPRPEVAREDIEATRAELEDLKRRARCKTA
jgi:hypothetical protein